jgi:Zn-dependent protease
MNELEIVKISATVIALVIAIIGHEIMHGWAAYKYGDTTAKSQGRLSVNPLVHVDPVGTILIPAVLYLSGAPFLFGWAKPVPVNMHTVLQNGGTNGAIAVSLAGIVYNFALAVLFSLMIPLLDQPESLAGAFVNNFVFQTIVLNVLLGFFNLWPIPPLDGANALRYIAEGQGFKKVVSFYDAIYPYGMILIILILVTPLSDLLFAPVRWIIKLLIS